MGPDAVNDADINIYLDPFAWMTSERVQQVAVEDVTYAPKQHENAAIFDQESPLNILTEVPEPTAQFN